jgi:hypothetical protein
MFSFSALASESEVQFLGTYGLETRLERNQDQMLVDRSLKNFSLGFSVDHWLYALEYNTFSESTGSNSLTVDRKVEAASLTLLWMGLPWGALRPLLGGGVGVSQETIKTQLLGAVSTDHGNPNYFGFGSLGARIDVDVIWLSVEFRVLGFQRADPNPTGDILGRLGFYF